MLEHLAGRCGMDRAEAHNLGLGEVLLQDAALFEELRPVLQERHAHSPAEAKQCVR